MEAVLHTIQPAETLGETGFGEAADDERRQLAERVLDLASRAGIQIVTAECYSGAVVSAALNEVQRNRQQFAGGYQFNCTKALRAMLEVDSSDPAELCLSMARSALRKSRAGMALAVIAPVKKSPSARIHLAAMDRCDHYWQADFRQSDIGSHDIPARALAFLADCIDESEAHHF